jgi:LuxR family maltose regulon positive regulatory protein
VEQGGLSVQQGPLPVAEDQLQPPPFSFPVLHRQRVIDALDRAARHRVTLVCGPAGTGKTVACATWAAAQPGDRKVAWLTLHADEDRAWFWADIWAALTRAGAVRPEAAESLADVSADDFPLGLAEVARVFGVPAVLVIDNAHVITNGAVLAGLDSLIRHAPPTWRLFLSGRQPPGLQLARLKASGGLAAVGAAALACTPAEADAYLALPGNEFSSRPDRAWTGPPTPAPAWVPPGGQQ